MIFILLLEIPPQEVFDAIEDIEKQIEDIKEQIQYLPDVAVEEESGGYFYLEKTVEIVNISTHPSLDI